MGLGRLAARLAIGGLFMGHGAQKLFGWFDGTGPEGTEQMMEKLEMRPAKANALLVGAAETGGGAMVAAGFLMPVGAAALIGSMVTAIRKVHGPKGLWNTGGGYEFNLTLIAALLALVDGGPGPISVDRGLGIDRTGQGWALAALAAGAAGSAIAIEAGKLVSEEARPEPMPEPSAGETQAERAALVERLRRFREEVTPEEVERASAASA